MRKLKLQVQMTVDGFISGQNGEMDYFQLEIDKMKEIDKRLVQFRKIWENRFRQLDKLLTMIKKQKYEKQLAI